MTTPPPLRSLVDFGLMGQMPRGVFEHVEAQVFPLLAERRRLQHFLDGCYTKVLRGCGMSVHLIAPVVMFTILHYPMIYGIDRAEAARLDQYEFFFLVPVELRMGDRRMTGVVTPYIYVSSSISASVGREIYGWPKGLYRIDTSELRVDTVRHDEELLLRVERPIPGLRGRQLAYKTVLELRHVARANPIRMGGADVPLWRELAEFPRAATLLANTIGGELLDMPPDQSVRGLMGGLWQLLRGVLRPGGRLTNFGIVQVPHPSLIGRRGSGRSSGRSSAATYQALTQTRMRVPCVHDLSLLGESVPSPFDPSAGYSLHLSGHGLDQIATRLGLQVWQRTTTRESVVDILRPCVPPLHVHFDMEIVHVQTPAWRTTHSAWRDRRGRPLGPAPAPGQAAKYNAWEGPSSAEGFSSYGCDPQEVQFKLLFLPAHAEVLNQLCREIAPSPPGVEIVPRHAGEQGVVMLSITRVKQSLRTIDTPVWFSGFYVSFTIPVDLRFEGRSRLMLLETHGFTDNPHALLVGRELLAANRWLASIDEHTQRWLPGGDPGAVQHLVRVKTAALRTINTGEAIADHVLFDLHEPPTLMRPLADTSNWRQLGKELIEDQVWESLRIGAVVAPTRGTLATRMVRANVERVHMGGDNVLSPPAAQPKPPVMRIFGFESMPLVRDLGLRGVLQDDGSTHVQCDFEIEGRSTNVRRDVQCLYDWTDSGWSTAGIRWLWRKREKVRGS